MSPTIEITRTVYFDRILGMWQGKFIGGTLGAPIEGVKDLQDFTEELALPTALTENDDTDIQILWLHALQEHGVRLTAIDLMREWREHMRGPWNEYGIAWANWERGFVPPQSGQVSNWFWGEGMGCPIRAEIWGAICPGAPALAARYAAMDASLDHTDNSVEAEKFLSALYAGAFLESDPRRLIAELALPVVTPDSRFHALVTDLLAWTLEESDWQVLRTRILADYGHPDMTHVLQNLGFTLLALLHSRGDFSRAMMISLNCGYDTDCTAGIAGAILGVTTGATGLARGRFAKGVSDRYVVSACMPGLPSKGSLSELTQSCLQIARDAATTFGTGVSLPASPGEQAAPPLAVTPQPLPTIPPRRGPVFPTWTITGPFWRNWDERRACDTTRKEHGNPNLPSSQYFSHVLAGFDRDWLAVNELAAGRPPVSTIARHWVKPAADNRLPMAGLFSRHGPLCAYAATWARFAEARRLWLMIGATGPVEVWWNGRSVLRSTTHQSLTPNTFALEVEAVAGTNSLVLKLARDATELEACVDFRQDRGRHWHQSFYETDFEWLTSPR